MSFNIVDIIIILFLVVYIFSRVKEGFGVLTSRLVSLFGGLVVASLSYIRLAYFLSGHIDWPLGILDAISFVVIFIFTQGLLRYIFSLLLSLLPAGTHPSFISRMFATLPAFIDGLIITVFILLVLVIVPIFPSAKIHIEDSRIGSQLVNQASKIEAHVYKIFGRASQETLGFSTIQTDGGEVRKLPFKPTSLSVDEESEIKMLDLINRERVMVGVSPVVIDETITLVARLHSEDMWNRSFFAHNNPDGDNPFSRMSAGGVDFRVAGENLALVQTVDRAHNGLMNSPGHRRNILDPNFKRVGIGVIDGGVYGKMFTQNFTD
ncbi:MAG: hypothetical protein COX06_01755 [Candidatus Zambryskibacteria bacterium CG22_combo_CG10-13_8_21_14_all_42_17]|uniref:SCP domain-containing protein n=1 Tax=Candidatus Zambryskibacteria bacterium CG22_combo_CG10-13_8_21_14_all_42_17 TaxID=1975118 RepID=A0A2H0BDM4_9BACT|nr:MAG: hypothetical protein COX06_01755 [Candidatus Zambryskibacteria bacterium CG22_combo_CG10-13_8_21_14_all_42_17]